MYKVLIAEDETLIQAGIRLSVPWEKLGMRVAASCADGNSAWQAFLTEKPDILLTDIRMPGMDGVALIRRVREYNTQCRIVVISCVEDFSVVKDILDQDVTAYLIKASMTVDDIVHTLERVRSMLDSLHSPRQDSERSLSLSVLMQKYVLERAIAPDSFLRQYHSLRGPGDLFSAVGAVRFGAVAPEEEEARRIIEKKARILGDHILLPLDDGLMMLIPDTVDAQLIRSCLTGIQADFGASPQNGIRMAVCLETITAEHLPMAAQACRRILELPFFYPELFYSVRSPEALSTSREDGTLSALCGHPLIKGLILCGNGQLKNELDALKCSNGKNQADFTNALVRVAGILKLHLDMPGELEAQIRSTGSADQAVGLVLNCLPECQENPLYAAAIEDTVNFLSGNFSERAIKLKDLADRCSFSPSYFAFLFRKATGMSFTEYLSVLRMEKARQLLENTRLSIRQVSDQCGFSAVSYFTHYFSQKAHCSPKEWRKKCGG